MRWLNLAIWTLWMLGLCGCAETRIYRDGKLAFVTQADATNITFRSGDIYFHADTLNHSKPTGTAYAGAGGAIGAAGAAVAAGAAGF